MQSCSKAILLASIKLYCLSLPLIISHVIASSEKKGILPYDLAIFETISCILLGHVKTNPKKNLSTIASHDPTPIILLS